MLSFSTKRKDIHKDIFLLCRKDYLKKTSFRFHLVKCAVWEESSRDDCGGDGGEQYIINMYY